MTEEKLALGLTEKLIKEVSSRPALWNYRNIYYHNRIVINTLWEEVAGVLSISKETAKLKWKGLRDTYRRELRKHRSRCWEQGVSFPDVLEPTWIHYQNMSFLKEYIKDTILDPWAPNSNEVHQTDDDFNSQQISNGGKNSKSNQKNGFVDPELATKEIPLRIEYEVINDDEDPLQSNNNNNLIKQEIIVVGNSDEEEEDEDDQSDSFSNQNSDRKRKYSYCDKYNKMKRSNSHNNSDYEEEQQQDDDDLLYFKSLLPYIKSLSPIRKLRVRSEIQNLIVKEMQNEEKSNVIPLEHVTTNMESQS